MRKMSRRRCVSGTRPKAAKSGLAPAICTRTRLPCHICSGTGLTLPHLLRDRVQRYHVCAGTALNPATLIPTPCVCWRTLRKPGIGLSPVRVRRYTARARLARCPADSGLRSGVSVTLCRANAGGEAPAIPVQRVWASPTKRFGERRCDHRCCDASAGTGDFQWQTNGLSTRAATAQRRPCRWYAPSHIGTGTALTRTTSVPGLGRLCHI